MAGNKNNRQAPTSTVPTGEELASVLQGFIDLVGDTNLKDLVTDVQSLKFDNERIVKPALVDIRTILSRDIYAPKTDVAELRQEIKDLKDELAKEKERTRNYALVEKIVFTLVGLILTAVVLALIGLVIVKGGAR